MGIHLSGVVVKPRGARQQGVRASAGLLPGECGNSVPPCQLREIPAIPLNDQFLTRLVVAYPLLLVIAL
jgi:hypothetical protein